MEIAAAKLMRFSKFCSYLIKGTMSNGISFIAYTYAGELPSCAFGLNTHGLVTNDRNNLFQHQLYKIVCTKEKRMRKLQAFTLNSVPPSEHEIVAGGIGRNFVSRDLLEASSIDDALCVRHISLSALCKTMFT